MGSKIDRTGERNVNSFGSEMIITRYRGCMDIDIYFPEYNWTVKNREYNKFKKGSVKCPYERSIYGIGYIGEGKYKVSENSKHTRAYDTWNNMLERCYSEKCQEKHPTYKDCEVRNEWHNFQNFAEWYEENYYEVDGERMCLDKDILFKHNKIYSPETCIYVPQTINNLFVKNDKNRGDSVIGTCYHKRDRIYESWCNIYNFETGKSKYEYLGRYDTQEKAFNVYKQFKENYIKQVADYYKKQIPINLYNALYNYKVEITD